MRAEAPANAPRLHARWARALRSRARSIARLLVAFGVLVAVLGGPASVAASALASAIEPAATCCCKHQQESDKKRCCCGHDESGDHCLPVPPAPATAASLAPPAFAAELVPIPPLLGLAETPEVARLLGAHVLLELERPPRA